MRGFFLSGFLGTEARNGFPQFAPEAVRRRRIVSGVSRGIATVVVIAFVMTWRVAALVVVTLALVRALVVRLALTLALALTLGVSTALLAIARRMCAALQGIAGTLRTALLLAFTLAWSSLALVLA
jgi:hypothetical protein